jgi:DNA polymerase-3 subunit gamma/tau
MSYQVLARKWRPKNFNELMGQSHVVTVLVNALSQQRLHHAYLFTGTRGVGKTTIARIFAKSLNCEQGITASPCGACDACVDIDQGKFVDLLEIDAASRTKVDDTREILDNVQYAPTRGRYKVYLIDEVHMLSRSSFNALLKTLEEPPEHVKFILATTDPQKLPITVLSRCLQFHLKALTVVQIQDKVKEILRHEAVSYDDEAIELLAKAARGSMRDCLSLTDQSIAQGQGNITRKNVEEMLGGVDQDWVYKILIELLKQDAASLMALSLEIASYAPSYSRLCAELIQLLHQVAMTQVVKSHFSLRVEHEKQLQTFCQLMSPEDVQLYYQIVLNARKDMPYAADEQAAFDMMLLRLLAFKPVSNPNELPESVKADDIASSSQVLDLLAQTLPAVAPKSNAEIIIKSDEEPTSLISDTIKESETVEDNVDLREELTASSLDKTDVHSGADDLAQEMLAIEQQAQTLATKQAEHTETAQNQEVTPPQLVEQQVSALHSTMEAEDNQQPIASTDALANPAPVIQEETASEFSSPVAAAIATRNMLRSRKKALGDDEKKSSDAIKRPDIAPSITEKEIQPVCKDVPNISSLPDQPYSESVIDPSIIKSANQIDKWANMIDSMSLIARLRQLAIHATIDERSTDDLLILQLDQTIKHLNSDAAHKKLEESISQYLQKKITVELNIVDKTIADPYQIQSDINSKRFDYAKQLLAEDELIVALQSHFQAELDQESIVAR